MKKGISVIIALVVIVAGIFLAGPLFVINEGEQAVIVQFGRIRNVVTNAGLHFKVPVIDEVRRFSKKILTWDGDPVSMFTSEQQAIVVDVTARWRISNPRNFYETFETIGRAELRIAEIINSAVRAVVAEHPIRESVRNSNIIMQTIDSTELEGDSLEAEIALLQSGNHEPIIKGRRQLAEEILSRSQRETAALGIELIDIVTRQIRFAEELTASVHSRMIRERNQVAQLFRSEGEGLKAKWLGEMESDQRALLSAAYNTSQTIMGVADAEAARIYADSYNQNRGFFEFWRSIESYRRTIPNFDKTISTDMDYFRYLRSAQGR